ncbi:MAG: helix-turn-helix domain-containing protein [Pirellulaceae bacterium]|nr:helix-turn-helix domain-containing protein [Pirellulaceae bacterium]
MDEPSSPAAELVRRHRQGDSQAARELFACYAQRLSRLAEQYLSRRLSGRVDGEDIVQSVFRTFFQRSARGEFGIDSDAQLWQLLVRITILKAREHGRRHTAGVRDVRMEQDLADSDWPASLAARQPGPEDAVILMDQIQSLLRGLPVIHCRVLELRLQGHSVAETAVRLGVSRTTVYRAVDLLQDRLAKSYESLVQNESRSQLS